MSFYRQQLEDWLKKINVKVDRVLDLGGASNPVRNRVFSWQVNECVFFDNGAESAKVDYMVFDINQPLDQFEGYGLTNIELQKIGSPDVHKVRSNVFEFDAIFCLEVFEYVWNPVQAVKNIWDLMTNDSVAYISFPSIYPVHNPVEIDYLRYTKEAIMKYLVDQGFEQIEITARVATEGVNDLAKFYSKEGMHPVRHSNLPFDIGYLVKCRKLV